MEKVIVFGTGYWMQKYLEVGYLDRYDIVSFVDNDKSKIGGVINGRVIELPEDGLKKSYDKILILVREEYAEEIRQQLVDVFTVSNDKIMSRKEVAFYSTLAEYDEKIFARLFWGYISKSRIPCSEVSQGEDSINDYEIVKRIVDEYNRACDNSRERRESWWESGYLWESKKDIHNKLISRNIEEICSVFKRPFSTNFFRGYCYMTKDYLLTEEAINGEVRAIYDQIVRLASYLGVIRIMNPERMGYAEIDIEKIFDAISEQFDVNLKFANPFPDELGMPTKRGIISGRAVQALYQVIKMKEILGGDFENAKILEIGAGLGRTAYFAHQFGNRNYTIIDIPMTNVAQAYFLGITLGEDVISLSGEESEGEIRIMPAHMIDKLANEHFELVVNVDSLTEMDEKSQKDYWEFVQNNSNVFFSINHEANEHTVREYYVGTDYRVRRNLCPMRAGYAEETIMLR